MSTEILHDTATLSVQSCCVSISYPVLGLRPSRGAESLQHRAVGGPSRACGIEKALVEAESTSLTADATVTLRFWRISKFWGKQIEEPVFSVDASSQTFQALDNFK